MNGGQRPGQVFPAVITIPLVFFAAFVTWKVIYIHGSDFIRLWEEAEKQSGSVLSFLPWMVKSTPRLRHPGVARRTRAAGYQRRF